MEAVPHRVVVAVRDDATRPDDPVATAPPATRPDDPVATAPPATRPDDPGPEPPVASGDGDGGRDEDGDGPGLGQAAAYEGVASAAERVLDGVDGALARLDDGTYGTCRLCGRPIGDDRLRQDPTATGCERHLDLTA